MINGEIDWGNYDPNSETFNAILGLPPAELEGIEVMNIGNDLECGFIQTTDCSKCMQNVFNEVRRSAYMCCQSHPETKETSDNGYCPNLDESSGFCKVYKTKEYPTQCESYHCQRHGR